MNMDPDEMREQADELEGWAEDALEEAEELRVAADEIEDDEDELDLLGGSGPFVKGEEPETD